MRVPLLRLERLVVRPLESSDLDVVDALFRELELDDRPRAARERWLAWTQLAYEQLDQLDQPPYGDRAVALRSTGEVVGLVGLVPSLVPVAEAPAARHAPEVGLFWAIRPSARSRGYATEAARGLGAWALTALRLRRLVATTTADNAASRRVMDHLGMRVTEEPARPRWARVMGVWDAL
jgi:RimJ/RimL family protein N-acetyltransferase